MPASAIPTLVLMTPGRTVGRAVGAQPEPVLAKQIDEALAAS